MLLLAASAPVWNSKEGRTFQCIHMVIVVYGKRGKTMEDVLHWGWRGPGRGRVQLVHLWRAVLSLWGWREKRGWSCSMQKPKAAPCLHQSSSRGACVRQPSPFPQIQSPRCRFHEASWACMIRFCFVWFLSDHCLKNVGPGFGAPVNPALGDPPFPWRGRIQCARVSPTDQARRKLWYLTWLFPL